MAKRERFSSIAQQFHKLALHGQFNIESYILPGIHADPTHRTRSCSCCLTA